MLMTKPSPSDVLPERAHARPIVRWVGGKRWLVPVASQVAYEHLQTTDGRYVEPFLGGGAVAADLGLPDMLLADLCEPLINAFQQLRRSPDAVLWSLKNYRRRGVDSDTYYKIRAERPRGKVQRAAWMFYMNTLGFNGVYRENSKGIYNVPYGVRKPGKKLPGKTPMVSHSFLTKTKAKPFIEAIRHAELVATDFRTTIRRAGDGDFIFVDSPYFGVYANYLKEGFGVGDHVDLARELRAAAEERGASFIATNNDVPEIRRLYRWAHITRTGEFRRVNRDAKKRGKVACLLIASSRDLLRSAGI
jgi:DNA adenine methylase